MSREAMEMALEALQFGLHVGFDESSESQIRKGSKAFEQHNKAIAALRDELDEAETRLDPRKREELDRAFQFKEELERKMDEAFQAEAPKAEPAHELIAMARTLERELAAVTAERDALRADAERYRWLRGDKAPSHSARWMRWEVRCWELRHWTVDLRHESLDAAIDAAMKGK